MTTPKTERAPHQPTNQPVPHQPGHPTTTKPIGTVEFDNKVKPDTGDAGVQHGPKSPAIPGVPKS
jgi:hypothetical protein